MSVTVTRLGSGPALFKTARRSARRDGGRSAHKWIWAILAIALGLVLYEMFSGKRAFTGKLRDELAPISGLVKEFCSAVSATDSTSVGVP